VLIDVIFKHLRPNRHRDQLTLFFDQNETSIFMVPAEVNFQNRIGPPAKTQPLPVCRPDERNDRSHFMI
jgi:hypothetical protein